MIDWSRVRRVTVFMPTWIGDVCMATPALKMLRAALPDGAHVTAAVRHGMRPLLRGHPAVDDLVNIEPRGVMGPWRAGRVLAATQPEVILVLPGSFRTALAARLAGQSRRIGYARDGRSWLLSDAAKPPSRTQPVSAVDWYCGLVGSESPDLPELIVTEEDRQAAASVMTEPPPAYVLLIPGANREDKRWPADRFATVANALHERHGWTAVIAGSPAERSLTAAVADGCDGPTIDLTERGGTLGALKAIAAGAEVAISNDTGPRHIAIAVGTPVVSLFGPTDHRWTLMEHAMERRLLAAPFLPDELMADRCGAACRIDRITVGDVLQIIDGWREAGRSILPTEP
ncbi:MAG: glycosyltransferase family 9 protein [Phycisphaerales bacterium]|nr:glycosyltransferase family 9 protein [Phycisphaerales bacterium]